MSHLVWFVMSGFVLTDATPPPPLPYLAFTARLVALAEALLLGVGQGVPEHDVITQGHMHAPAGLGLACKGHNNIIHAGKHQRPAPDASM